MSKEKIKRTYLKFATDKDGSVNIKFGPQRHAGEMEEFFKLLMMGNIQSIGFLSSVTKDPEARENLFHRVGDTYNAILLDSFPDIEEKILKEDSIIAEAIEAAEEGKQILSDEEEINFQEKKEELKEKLVEEFTEIKPVNVVTQEELVDQLDLRFGIDYDDLIQANLIIEKATEGKYLNQKDRDLLSKLSYIGLYELDKKYELLNILEKQKKY